LNSELQLFQLKLIGLANIYTHVMISHIP
jgi:hypothetical protein